MSWTLSRPGRSALPTTHLNMTFLKKYTQTTVARELIKMFGCMHIYMCNYMYLHVRVYECIISCEMHLCISVCMYICTHADTFVVALMSNPPQPEGATRSTKHALIVRNKAHSFTCKEKGTSMQRKECKLEQAVLFATWKIWEPESLYLGEQVFRWDAIVKQPNMQQDGGQTNPKMGFRKGPKWGPTCAPHAPVDPRWA